MGDDVASDEAEEVSMDLLLPCIHTRRAVIIKHPDRGVKLQQHECGALAKGGWKAIVRLKVGFLGSGFRGVGEGVLMCEVAWQGIMDGTK